MIDTNWQTKLRPILTGMSCWVLPSKQEPTRPAASCLSNQGNSTSPLPHTPPCLHPTHSQWALLVSPLQLQQLSRGPARLAQLLYILVGSAQGASSTLLGASSFECPAPGLLSDRRTGSEVPSSPKGTLHPALSVHSYRPLFHIPDTKVTSSIIPANPIAAFWLLTLPC